MRASGRRPKRPRNEQTLGLPGLKQFLVILVRARKVLSMVPCPAQEHRPLLRATESLGQFSGERKNTGAEEDEQRMDFIGKVGRAL